MPIVVPNQGAPLLLQQSLGIDTGYSLGMDLHLYTNNYAPVPSSVPASFTEAAFSGYSPVVLDPTKFLSPVIISDRASVTYDAPGPIEWTNLSGSPVTIYGYYILNDDIGYVIFAEKFATSRTLQPGDKLDLTAVITGGTQL